MSPGSLLLQACVLVLCASASASGQDRPRWPDPEVTVDAGYVFIDHQYVPAPYKLTERDGALLINDVAVTRPRSERGDPRPGSRFNAQGSRGDERRPPGPGWGRPGTWGGPPPDRGARWLSGLLINDGVVFGFRERPPVVVENYATVSFLKSLTSRATDDEALAFFLNALPPQEDRSEWTAWLASYKMPAALHARATEAVQKSDEISRKNEAAGAAVRRLHRFSYPLNVVGMVAGVLAVGHLLRSLPKRAHESPGEQILTEQQSATLLSVGFVALFSALDLVWTILAWQAGQMTELNPLGSHLIEDPLALSIFKISTTLISCGLLVALRRHPRAQFASWWLCLLCTILTFRWLVVNSLFVV